VRRRLRAAAFAGLALLCAAIAASLAGDYRGSVEAQLGTLRPVVVARAELPRDGPLSPADARELLEVRRVPARFAPVDPLEVIGRSVRTPLPAGAYVTASVMHAPGPRPDPAERPGRGREAVEIAVAGAGALAASGNPVGRRFDVVVTGEPGGDGGPGRTRIVADGVELLALEPAGPGPDALSSGGSPAFTATVAAGRREALRLIQAHNYAREVRLIGTA